MYTLPIFYIQSAYPNHIKETLTLNYIEVVIVDINYGTATK